MGVILMGSFAKSDWEFDGEDNKESFSEFDETDVSDSPIANTPDPPLAQDFSRPSDSIEDKSQVHSQLASSVCTCKDRVNKALVKSIQSCTDVLDALQNCRAPPNRTAPNVALMSSCDCSDNVTAALTAALKSCTDAVSTTVSCGSSGRPLASSCAEIKRNNPSSQSGFYTLLVNNQSISVYCNMDTLCRAGGGWTRLGFLNMTNSATICPTGLQQRTINGVRMCALQTAPGCTSVLIPSNGIRYSRVCGRVRGYQGYSTDGFHVGANINLPYVDGVSITRGSPRTHIWSLGSGFTEVQTNVNACPCNSGASNSARPPLFVGNDWYCESGAPNGPQDRFYTDDPLWDKLQCRGRESGCCVSLLQPWFLKSTGSTTEFIELRVCLNQALSDESISIDQYEFFVQ